MASVRTAPHAAGRATKSPGEGPPPEGPPWDLPLDEAPLAFLDLEMTGLALDRGDRVIEVCIERVRGGVVEARLESLVDPGPGTWDARSGDVHGIAVATLASAPPFASIAAAVVEILDGAVPVAHAAEWDLAFLHAELERVGLAGPTHALDTLVLARRAFFQPSYALAALARAFAIDPGTAHRAGDDVRTLRGVYAHVRRSFRPRPRVTCGWSASGERAPPGVVAACQEAVTRGTPVQVTYRPASSGPKEFGMVMTAVDGPHVHGFMVPSRGRRTLLLARVLRVEPLPP
ncbi:MAG: 3'-5' exonuclease [Myxococcales bacterium]|nr:3'-5' exonuclease [Myxococcales bacterium]